MGTILAGVGKNLGACSTACDTMSRSTRTCATSSDTRCFSVTRVASAVIATCSADCLSLRAAVQDEQQVLPRRVLTRLQLVCITLNCTWLHFDSEACVQEQRTKDVVFGGLPELLLGCLELS
jgi:hypothetical protein